MSRGFKQAGAAWMAEPDELDTPVEAHDGRRPDMDKLETRPDSQRWDEDEWAKNIINQ